MVEVSVDHYCGVFHNNDRLPLPSPATFFQGDNYFLFSWYGLGRNGQITVKYSRYAQSQNQACGLLLLSSHSGLGGSSLAPVRRETSCSRLTFDFWVPVCCGLLPLSRYPYRHAEIGP